MPKGDRRKYTPEKAAWMRAEIKRLTESGLNCQKVAKILKCSPQTVLRYRKLLGVKFKSQFMDKRARRRLVALNYGFMTHKEISEKYGIGHNTIQRDIEEMGLKKACPPGKFDNIRRWRHFNHMLDEVPEILELEEQEITLDLAFKLIKRVEAIGHKYGIRTFVRACKRLHITVLGRTPSYDFFKYHQRKRSSLR